MASNSRSGFRQRLSQLVLLFQRTREVDPRFVPLLAGSALVVLVLCIAVGAVLGRLGFGIAFGVPLAVLVALFVFGRRTATAQYAALEGQPGAAAAVLQSLRGAWIVTPAVAFTRKQDFVHRAVGRPGVVLIGEGAPARVAQLLRQEHRRIAKVIGDVPVHEISVGNGEGQVPLNRLQFHLQRLRRAIKAREVGPLNTRLSALGDTDLPLPKGPLPRMARGKRR